MKTTSPLTSDEILFTQRLLFETLNFNESIKNTAEPRFRALGLTSGAIENFIRVMQVSEYTMLQKIKLGHEPPPVGLCPWKTQAMFLERVSEIQGWLKENGGEPCDVKAFICETQSNASSCRTEPSSTHSTRISRYLARHKVK